MLRTTFSIAKIKKKSEPVKLKLETESRFLHAWPSISVEVSLNLVICSGQKCDAKYLV